MHLLFIGIGNPVPSFIQRRLSAYVRAGIQITVVAEAGQSLQDLRGVHAIRIGGRKSAIHQVSAGLRLLVSPLLFFRLLATRPELSFRQRIKWAVKYFPLAQAVPPDVVHFQWLSYVPEFRWLRQFFTCPFVASARGSQVTVYPVTRQGYKEIIEEAIRAVDYIHCVSHDMARACEQLGATQAQLVVNYNGIDLTKFQRLEWPESPAVFTMISVGAMMWRKGFYHQLQVLKKLRDEKRKVMLLWIGDGPDREGLQYTARLLAVDDCITFAGKVKPDDLPGWLSRADVYLSTSVAEGLANSVVEATACGLPVVAFACEGMTEVLQPGANGFILPVGDVQGMANKVMHLMDHPEERKAMQQRSRQLATEKFDERTWVLRMIKTYETLERK